MSIYNCPLHGISYGHYCPRCQPYQGPGHYSAPPQGCICPPTSEATCQNPICPRKPRSMAVQGNLGDGLEPLTADVEARLKTLTKNTVIDPDNDRIEGDVGL